MPARARISVFAEFWALWALLISIAVLQAGDALAAPKITVNDQLGLIRKRVLGLEREIVDGSRAADRAQDNVRKIRALLVLQKQERALGLKRQAELELTVKELESRKAVLDTKILDQRAAIRRALVAIERSEDADSARTPEQEKWEAPRRQVLAALVDRGVKETEALRIDLEDANQLEGKIGDERQQLAEILQDLDEQQSILELNRRIQADLIHKHDRQRIAQLDNYRKLKSAEGQVEDLIHDFNSRVELEKQTEKERRTSKAVYEKRQLNESAFARLKGKLLLPVAGGRILTRYGRSFDASSGLYIFKKGVEISSDKKQPVRAVSAGRVAFAGELPDYGRVTIVDHGDHFYSICAHLGEVSRKTGDQVASGDPIGLTDDSGTPVYFEIRAQNVPVNPLQWVSN